MKRRDGVVMGGLVAVVLGMVGLSFAAVPLYGLFCRATGFGGTTQRVQAAASSTIGRRMEIRFNTDVNSQLPWDFRPNQRSVALMVGETGMATFHAHNSGATPVVGTAVYNVTPEKAGLYFDKIQCFCFTQQILAAGESADLPVAFYIDPAIAKDHNLDDVSVITLSYTFYKAQSQALDKAVGAEGRAAETEQIEKAAGKNAASRNAPDENALDEKARLKASLNAASTPAALAARAPVE